jgi:hypothetical protein
MPELQNLEVAKIQISAKKWQSILLLISNPGFSSFKIDTQNYCEEIYEKSPHSVERSVVNNAKILSFVNTVKAAYHWLMLSAP